MIRFAWREYMDFFPSPLPELGYVRGANEMILGVNLRLYKIGISELKR